MIGIANKKIIHGAMGMSLLLNKVINQHDKIQSLEEKFIMIYNSTTSLRAILFFSLEENYNT